MRKIVVIIVSLVQIPSSFYTNDQSQNTKELKMNKHEQTKASLAASIKLTTAQRLINEVYLSLFTSILKAGGTITKPIFFFPGGRRYHFPGPNGNEYGVGQDSQKQDIWFLWNI